jgi:uncharacterized protein (TIRG00374 family)
MTKVRLLSIAVAIAVVTLFVVRSEPDEVWAVLQATDYRLVVVAALLNIPVALLAPLRSSLIFHRLGHAVPAPVLIPTTVVGFVAGGLTPAASGEILRAGALRSRAGVPFEDTMAVVVFERVLSVYLLALTAAALFAFASLPLAWYLPVASAAVVLVLLPWLAATLSRPFLRGPEQIGGQGALAAVLRYMLAMATQIRFLLENPRLLLQWSLVSVTMFAVIAVQYWLLARAVAGGINLAEAWMALGVSTVAAVVSLLPFGLGVLDASLAATLSRLGMTLEQGGVVAILVRAAVTLPLVFAALACYLYLQRSEAAAARPDLSDVS